MGAGGLLLLIVLGLLTAFILPLVLLMLGAFAPGGRVITYFLTRRGGVKRTIKAAK